MTRNTTAEATRPFVSAVSVNHYEYWEKVLGKKIPNAAFGENFSVTDMNEDGVCIGDIYCVGTAMMQVSQPHQPFQRLPYDRKGRFVKLVVGSGRTGLLLEGDGGGKGQSWGRSLVLRETF